MEPNGEAKLPNLIELKASLSQFKEAINNIYAKHNPIVIVVDFYAKWCGPCRRLLTKIPGIAEQFPKAFFIKMNVDENREVANHFHVRSLPTIKFFGKENNEFTELTHIVGYRPLEIGNILERMIQNRKATAKIHSCKYDYDHPPLNDDY